LQEKQYLHEKFYEGGEIKIAEILMAHIFYEFLDYYGLIVNNKSDVDYTIKINILQDILKLSDSDFIRFIYTLERPWYVLYLFENLLTGRIFLNCKEYNLANTINSGVIGLVHDIIKKYPVYELINRLEEKLETTDLRGKKIKNSTLDIILSYFLYEGILLNQWNIFRIEKYFWDNFIITIEDIKIKIIEEFANQFIYEEVLSYLKVPQIYFGVPLYILNGRFITPVPLEDRLFEYDNRKYIYLNDYFFLLEYKRLFYQPSFSVQLLIPDYLSPFSNLIIDRFEAFIKSFDWLDLTQK